MRRLIFLTLFGLPGLVQAVSVSEVAWMGSLSSADHEWIELFHWGPGIVSLDGWTITDGRNFNITLSGQMAPGTYAVLERTSDEVLPIAALLVYTGTLVNTGGTLTLRDKSGQVADEVIGGKNWETIGGDNSTKETAQRTERGWITAPPTPGQVNKVLDLPVKTDPPLVTKIENTGESAKVQKRFINEPKLDSGPTSDTEVNDSLPSTSLSLVAKTETGTPALAINFFTLLWLIIVGAVLTVIWWRARFA